MRSLRSRTVFSTQISEMELTYSRRVHDIRSDLIRSDQISMEGYDLGSDQIFRLLVQNLAE